MAIYASPLADVDLYDGPITEYVFRHADRLADATAMTDAASGRSYTYEQLLGAVKKAAGGFAARGYGKGDVVAIMSPNLPEYAVAFHGAAYAGVTVTTLNPLYTAEEIAFQLKDSGAQAIITVSLFLETAAKAAAGTAVKEIFVFGEDEGATPFAELLAGDALAAQVPVDARSDVVVLPYSSGTTGFPKGVKLSHYNLAANLAQIEPIFALEEGEVAIAVLPFFHIYGMQVLMNGMMHVGASVVSMPRFDLVEFLEAIQTHEVTRAYLVPPIVLALAKHPVIDNYDLSSLRQVFSGAAPLGADVAQEAAGRIDAEVVQGYGMTEVSPVTHATAPGDFKPGSVGVTVPNTETRIVDPATGEDLGLDDDGEVWVRGPQVMLGYLNNEEATAAMIDDDGWLRTGDIGHVDADDHVYIVDRLKELIKYKGFQVPPAELEALPLTHPGIADAAVIGIPDEEAGEIPKAFVVVKPDEELTADDVAGFVSGHVASYKEIRVVAFVDEIPKSASGKILRRLLRDQESGAGVG